MPSSGRVVPNELGGAVGRARTRSWRPCRCARAKLARGANVLSRAPSGRWKMGPGTPRRSSCAARSRCPNPVGAAVARATAASEWLTSDVPQIARLVVLATQPAVDDEPTMLREVHELEDRVGLSDVRRWLRSRRPGGRNGREATEQTTAALTRGCESRNDLYPLVVSRAARSSIIRMMCRAWRAGAAGSVSFVLCCLAARVVPEPIESNVCSTRREGALCQLSIS